MFALRVSVSPAGGGGCYITTSHWNFNSGTLGTTISPPQRYKQRSILHTWLVGFNGFLGISAEGCQVLPGHVCMHATTLPAPVRRAISVKTPLLRARQRKGSLPRRQRQNTRKHKASRRGNDQARTLAPSSLARCRVKVAPLLL